LSDHIRGAPFLDQKVQDKTACDYRPFEFLAGSEKITLKQMPSLEKFGEEILRLRSNKKQSFAPYSYKLVFDEAVN
jgi:hypothetical protein